MRKEKECVKDSECRLLPILSNAASASSTPARRAPISMAIALRAPVTPCRASDTSIGEGAGLSFEYYKDDRDQFTRRTKTPSTSAPPLRRAVQLVAAAAGRELEHGDDEARWFDARKERKRSRRRHARVGLIFTRYRCHGRLHLVLNRERRKVVRHSQAFFVPNR